jgi:type I restriction enzyme R subunit
MSRSEARTRKELIDPKLEKAGWSEHDWQIEWEYQITDGRIHFDGKVGRRGTPKKADYLLRYAPSKAIAVVEAKKESDSHLEGAAQAKEYAQKLGLWFAYSTNGHEIEFFDLKKNNQTSVDRFHSPEELWNMYLEYSGIRPSREKLTALLHDFYDESQLGKRRKPRYYQEMAVNRAVEAVINGKSRVLITQATGTGKTFTSLQLVYKLWKSGVSKRTLFIVDRNLLADQAFQDFNNAFDKDSCYRMSPNDEKFPQGRAVYFGIYQTLVGLDDEGNETGKPDRYKEFPPDFFDLIVIDEAHRGGTKEDGSWFRLLNYFKSSVQVGLTATPKRDENNNTYDYFGEPVVNYSLKDGIEDGFLSPYIIKRVTSNIDALGYRPEHSDIKDVAGRKLLVKDYLTPSFERELSIPERTRAFAYHLLRHLWETDITGKTIVFCIDQRHALDMAKYCKEAFEKYNEKYQLGYTHDFAVRITGNDKDAKGKYPDLENFQNLECSYPVIVTTSKLLTTGVDVRTVKNVVIFRNVGSMVEFKQIIGRGTRVYPHPDRRKEKLGFYILEYANNSTALFNDPEWDDNPVEVIEEGSISIDEKAKSYDSPDEEITVDPSEPVPVAENEAQIPSTGIFEEQNEENLENIRYRMSEDFMRGRVKMAAEHISFTGPDGKPLTADKFTLFQSELFLQKFKSAAEFNAIWRDIKTRRHFLEKEAFELGLQINALMNIFESKYQLREVDLYDVLSNLMFGARFLSKLDRAEKAVAVNPNKFKGADENQNTLIKDMLQVYQDSGFETFTTSSEFFQTSTMKRHGGFADIQRLAGGKDGLQRIVNNIQEGLYDPKVVA